MMQFNLQGEVKEQLFNFERGIGIYGQVYVAFKNVSDCSFDVFAISSILNFVSTSNYIKPEQIENDPIFIEQKAIQNDLINKARNDAITLGFQKSEQNFNIAKQALT